MNESRVYVYLGKFNGFGGGIRRRVFFKLFTDGAERGALFIRYVFEPL